VVQILFRSPVIVIHYVASAYCWFLYKPSLLEDGMVTSVEVLYRMSFLSHGNLIESFWVCYMNVLFYFGVLIHFHYDCVLAYDAL